MTKIRITEVTHSVFYAPNYVAINLGFFKDEGIEIELTNGAGTDKVMTAVLSGQAEIGFGGPEATIYVYNQGKDDYPIFFAQVTKRDGSFLMARKPMPNFKWRDLRGKKIIGGRKGGVPEMTLEYVLKKNNLIPGKNVDVDTNVQFALMAGAFIGGQGDYVTLFEPTASLLEREGKGFIVASIGQESGEIPYTGYFAKKSFLEKNAGLVQRLTKALYRGQQWVASHSPTEIAKIIRPSFPDADEALLTVVAKRYKDQDTWTTDPVLKRSAFSRLQSVMVMAGELKKKAPYDRIINTTFAQKATRSAH
jgi:NitT/TauT family transport system substrate-binding protein